MEVLPTFWKTECRSVSDILLQLGFTDGVFHVEARVSQSSMEMRDENGIVDLVPTSSTHGEDVRCHLIEINARPPGLRAQILTRLTFGIDYFATRILSAVDDKERMKASCQPFNLPEFPQGAQHWSQLVHLPVLSKGTTDGVAALEKFLHQLPDALPYVVEYQCCFEPGETLPDPAEYADVFGHCIVASTQSRRHAVEIADRILTAYHANGIEQPQAIASPESKSMAIGPIYESLYTFDKCTAPAWQDAFRIELGK
jgi:hypothetical protein